jgi:hypothetical protein
VQFPCWRYHATQPAVIVNDPEELESLGEGWADTPAAFDGSESNSSNPESNPEDPNEGEGKTAAARCKCGKYTLANAEKKAHVCAE